MGCKADVLLNKGGVNDTSCTTTGCLQVPVNQQLTHSRGSDKQLVNKEAKSKQKHAHHVLAAVHNLDVAVGPDLRKVSRLEPAVRRDGRACGFCVAQVACVVI